MVGGCGCGVMTIEEGFWGFGGGIVACMVVVKSREGGSGRLCPLCLWGEGEGMFYFGDVVSCADGFFG